MESSEFEEKMFFVNCIFKIYQGGCCFWFVVLVILGDCNGCVGMGIGKVKEVFVVIEKVKVVVCKNMIIVLVENGIIFYEIVGENSISCVLFKFVGFGIGVIVGIVFCLIVEFVGIINMLFKEFGSCNKVNVVYVVFDGFKNLCIVKQVCNLCGIEVCFSLSSDLFVGCLVIIEVGEGVVDMGGMQ